MDTKSYLDNKAIQFNGWNFGCIYDWISGKIGVHPACFYETMKVGGKTVFIDDWVGELLCS